MAPVLTRLTRRVFLPSAFFLLLAGGAHGQAPAPAPDSPGAREEQTDARIRFFQMQVARDPDFPVSYNRLASALALKARESGDISYLELAEAALKKSLALESTHVDAAPAFTQLATVYLAEHRFREALTEAQSAIRLDPKELSPYPYAGDAELEQGNYDAARQLYARLSDPSVLQDGRPHRGIQFLAASRAASYDWIMGDTAKAADDMRLAAQLAQELHMPAENVAWTHFMLGEQLFQQGKLEAARREEQQALEAFPRYHRALAEMGRVEAAEGHLDQAMGYYRQAMDVVPLPVYASALGDLYQLAGKPAEAQKQYGLVEFIAKLSQLSHDVYNRELAMFYADHDRSLPLAVELCRKELTVRHDVYTWDALAWALVKNGETAEARSAIGKALEHHTADALIEYHAGVIFSRSGDQAKAAAHLSRALALNPNFHVIYAEKARQLLKTLPAVQG